MWFFRLIKVITRIYLTSRLSLTSVTSPTSLLLLSPLSTLLARWPPHCSLHMPGPLPVCTCSSLCLELECLSPEPELDIFGEWTLGKYLTSLDPLFLLHRTATCEYINICEYLRRVSGIQQMFKNNVIVLNYINLIVLSTSATLPDDFSPCFLLAIFPVSSLHSE